ncbi:MAG TPA: tetraacyldisaccharide 4'-kinase [Candidatus Omnitrophota bacterium]|nr:tetraacyldisaccharide 4'-kinase [Candidatus Omnitrophota bacterium]HQO57350.1 tetraacyldisaccharide 4'-kinase [Candidatus Omnitrophota bacterium]
MQFRLYLYEVISGRKHGPLAAGVRGVLRFLSMLYALVIRIWLAAYDRRFLPVKELGKPAVSVGNITWGGVGKTPFVEWLARYFLECKVRPAILTRGYMPSQGGRALFSGSDEARMLQKKFPDMPVVAGRDRRKGAREILSQRAVDVFILDDGFQHRGVKRDLDIVLIDTTNPFGNRFLLPRGSLREPLSSLRRADVFVLTKTDQTPGVLDVLKDQLKTWNPSAIFVETIHQPVSFSASRSGMALADIKGHPVCLVSGIGDPGSFEKMVVGLGALVRDTKFFPDHHCFSAGDVEDILQSCQTQGIRVIIMTAKDAVKWPEDFECSSSGLKVLVLNMDIKITKGKEALLARLRTLRCC